MKGFNKRALYSEAAVCLTVTMLCSVSFLSGTAHRETKVALVAPLFIASNEFVSSLTLKNNAAATVEAIVVFESLEGEETARKPLSLAANSTISLDINSVTMTPHRFASLGSISVLMADRYEGAVVGHVTITSRRTGTIRVDENLQPVGRSGRLSNTAHVPASYSVPVVAVHSLGSSPQHITITCAEHGGRDYESQMVIPPQMTFLLNACIQGRGESRTYEQLLRGDTGRLRESATIRVGAVEDPGGISAWGFAVRPATATTDLKIIGIDFSD